MGLSGTIDIDALLQIPSLRTISFINNSFSGPIPDINRIGALKAIYLNTNQFSGSIPPDFFTKLASLKKLWLNDNKFSGNIPVSLTNLRFLSELRLDNNDFSGTLPAFSQPMRIIDFSNNRLEGQIPPSMAGFEASSFAGNQALCGKPLKECGSVDAASSEQGSSGTHGGLSWFWKILFILLLATILAAVFILVKNRRDQNDKFSVMSRGNSHVDEEVMQVKVAKSGKGTGIGRRGGGGRGDLIMVNDEKGVFGLTDLMKAAAEVLGNGGLGSAYKAAMANGLSVVVKRMREMNKVSRDIFDAEMRRYGRMGNRNILSPLAYHYRKEEKLFVTEYIPKGSLLYVLHGDRGSSHGELTWPRRLMIVKGIAKGLGFLYSEFSTEELPHGNLKSSNILLSNEYEALLSDFGFHSLMNPKYAAQTLFAYKTPDYTEYQQVSQKTDVYCLGIIILEIITGKFPSQYHSNGKGGTDVVQWVSTALSDAREADLIDPDLLHNNNNSVSQMLQLLHLGAACTEPNPQQRLPMKEAIRRIDDLQP
ncbi:Pollen receptor-like kinase 3 [Stylosanthes scabra]|uniref:Pollen receptor-like kinase 3 n=1 Tax=Stylosanthes scabra TaxID=79078 RepID=A0ABU6U6N9_9FABA|nr:Pollen receptor-like kinase 3 [Stylosanthes scabra]